MVATGASPPTVCAQSLLSHPLGRKGTQGESELPGRGARPDGRGSSGGRKLGPHSQWALELPLLPGTGALPPSLCSELL